MYSGGSANANGTGSAEPTTASGGSTSAAPSPTGAAGLINTSAWSLVVGAAAVGAAALL